VSEQLGLFPEPEPNKRLRRQRATRGPKPSGQWSGPIPGQTVLHQRQFDRTERDDQRHTGDQHLTVDTHGFVQQPLDKRYISPYVGLTDDLSTAELYKSHGGRFAKPAKEVGRGMALREYGPKYGHVGSQTAMSMAKDVMGSTQGIINHNLQYRAITAHWERQPLVHIRADSPLTTMQPPSETEGESWNGETPHGRRGIDAIKEDLAMGRPLREPAWVVKDRGRLFVLDGHHRVVAAREAGLEHIPVRLWDRDAETGWTPESDAPVRQPRQPRRPR
jgi:hypothetical protein